MKSYILALAVAVFVALAGCPGISGGPSPGDPSTESAMATSETPAMVTEQDYPTWSLSILIVDATPEPGGTFNATIATGGTHQGVVSGVVVQFIDENGTVISENPVGNITEPGNRHWVNTTIPTVPIYIVPKVESWETPESEFDHIAGTQVTAAGEFHPYSLTDPANFTR